MMRRKKSVSVSNSTELGIQTKFAKGKAKSCADSAPCMQAQMLVTFYIAYALADSVV